MWNCFWRKVIKYKSIFISVSRSIQPCGRLWSRLLLPRQKLCAQSYCDCLPDWLALSGWQQSTSAVCAGVVHQLDAGRLVSDLSRGILLCAWGSYPRYSINKCHIYIIKWNFLYVCLCVGSQIMWSPCFRKLQMKQQSNLNDARGNHRFWTYFRENHTVVIGYKYIILQSFPDFNSLW